jgi:hypothetical protein
MNTPAQLTKKRIDTKYEKLKKRIAELEHIKEEYGKNLRKLTEKEAFNFALFQYNPALTVIVDREGRIVKTNAAKKRYGGRIPNIGDIMYKDYASHHQCNMYQELMNAMESNSSRHFEELPYDDKILSVTIAPFPQGAIIISSDITKQKKAERDLCNLVSDLKRALDEVETLRGLLPICAGCKKIRDDKGYWNHIEVYFHNHSHVDFTHTLCPDCIRHFYPEYWKKQQERTAASTKNGEVAQ